MGLLQSTGFVFNWFEISWFCAYWFGEQFVCLRTYVLLVLWVGAIWVLRVLRFCWVSFVGVVYAFVC